MVKRKKEENGEKEEKLPPFLLHDDLAFTRGSLPYRCFTMSRKAAPVVSQCTIGIEGTLPELGQPQKRLEKGDCFIRKKRQELRNICCASDCESV